MTSTNTWTTAKTYASMTRAVVGSFLNGFVTAAPTAIDGSFLNGLTIAAPTVTSKPFKELPTSLAFSFKRKSKTLLIKCCKQDCYVCHGKDATKLIYTGQYESQ